MKPATSSPARRRSSASSRAAARNVASLVRQPKEGGSLAEIQRARILIAAAEVTQKVGYAQATVAQVTARARVSRRTFYELFDNREECLVALVEDVIALVERELANAKLAELPWRERVRGGLWTILCFLDREPALAQLSVVEPLGGGPQVLELRERTLARLASVLDEGRSVGNRSGEHMVLTAEGLVGAAFGVVHARLLRRDPRPLRDLLGELMGLIVLSYLGPAAGRREQARPAPELSLAPRSDNGPSAPGDEQDPLRDLPMRLTYRTALVLSFIDEQPGVSNRMVADRVGITDQGQMSKLLARLARLGLAANDGAGHSSGEANAWTLTPLGRQVARRLSVVETNKVEAA